MSRKKTKDPAIQVTTYSRVMLKLSGEALIGQKDFGIDPVLLGRVADEIIEGRRAGVEVAVVIGGGNFFRGAHAGMLGMDRSQADHVGMLATVMNALVLQGALEKRGQFTTRVTGSEHEWQDSPQTMWLLLRNSLLVEFKGVAGHQPGRRTARCAHPGASSSRGETSYYIHIEDLTKIKYA